MFRRTQFRQMSSSSRSCPLALEGKALFCSKGLLSSHSLYQNLQRSKSLVTTLVQDVSSDDSLRQKTRELKPDVFAERSSGYKTGGYHPVHIGDTMQSGRYRILQKLGHGDKATIWLAEDNR